MGKIGRKTRKPAIDHFNCIWCMRWFETEEDVREHMEKKHLRD